MNAKVYVLLDVSHGKANQVAQALRAKPGVVAIDLLEGPPDVVLTVEAPNRQKLAEFTVEALTLVESMTEETQLLPVCIGSEGYEVKKIL